MGKVARNKEREKQLKVERLDCILKSSNSSKKPHKVSYLYSNLEHKLGTHAYSIYYVRNPRKFISKSKNEDNAKKEFLRYCFGKYHILPCLINGWETNQECRTYAVVMGNGKSLWKESDMKEFMTKKEIHIFVTRSSSSLTFSENVVRAKGICQGISDKTINKIIASYVFYNRNMMNIRNLELLSFFFKFQDRIEDHHILNEISDFVLNQVGDFSLKGRTWDSVSRLS